MQVKKYNFTASKFVMLLIPSFAAVSILLFFFGTYYIQMMLPLITFEFEKIYPDGEVLSTDFVKVQNRQEIHFTIRTHKYFVDEHGTSWPVSDLSVGIGTFALYIHPLLVLTLLLALPTLSKREKAIAVCISLPLIAFSVLADIPFHILYVLKENYLTYASQVPVPISRYLSFWYHALNSGGRQFLSLLAAGLTFMLFHLFFSHRNS